MTTNIKPYIWITKTTLHSEELCSAIQSLGYQVINHPVVTVETLDVSDDDKSQISSTSTLVITSANAVESFIENKIELSANQLVIAIDELTAKAMQKNFNLDDVLIPDKPTSQSLLELTNNLGISELVICKGVGGRNMLETALVEDGVEVSEVNLYQRTLVAIEQSDSKQWQQHGVNVIIATSNEIADGIYQQCDNEWLDSCHWIASSDKVARYVRKKGAANISIANSASDQDMLTAIKEC